MKRNKIYMMLRLVKICSKNGLQKIIDFENLAPDKKFTGMFSKRLIQVCTQSSVLLYNSFVKVGFIGSFQYGNAAF